MVLALLKISMAIFMGADPIMSVYRCPLVASNLQRTDRSKNFSGVLGKTESLLHPRQRRRFTRELIRGHREEHLCCVCGKLSRDVVHCENILDHLLVLRAVHLRAARHFL